MVPEPALLAMTPEVQRSPPLFQEAGDVSVKSLMDYPKAGGALADAGRHACGG